MNRQGNSFDNKVRDYDSWFETERGATIFSLELECLQSSVDFSKGEWLEVGVGTGRFAQALKVKTGIDPSDKMSAVARKRGIKVFEGCGEDIPFENGSFDGVLLLCTLSFLNDPHKFFSESRRVVKKDGLVVVGFIPADSLWGIYNTIRGRVGHRYYSSALFYTAMEVEKFAEKAALTKITECGCVLPDLTNMTDCSGTNNQVKEKFSFKVHVYQ